MDSRRLIRSSVFDKQEGPGHVLNEFGQLVDAAINNRLGFYSGRVYLQEVLLYWFTDMMELRGSEYVSSIVVHVSKSVIPKTIDLQPHSRTDVPINDVPNLPNDAQTVNIEITGRCQHAILKPSGAKIMPATPKVTRFIAC